MGLLWQSSGWNFTFQWMQGVWVQSPVGELRSHMPQGQKKKQNLKKQQKQYCNKLNKDLKNAPHQVPVDVWQKPTQYCKALEHESHSVLSDSLRPRGLYSPWNSPGQNTGVGSLSLLQGIFPTQGSNPGIEPRSPALRADSLPAELQRRG